MEFKELSFHSVRDSMSMQTMLDTLKGRGKAHFLLVEKRERTIEHSTEEVILENLA